MKGKTKSGFTFSVSENLGDDMELLEALTKLDKGEVVLVPFILERVLGEKQKKKLYDHVRLDDGRVPISAVSKELVEIFQSQETVKK